MLRIVRRPPNVRWQHAWRGSPYPTGMSNTHQITDVPLAELRRMLADTEQLAERDSDAARILRRVIARREAMADQVAMRGGHDDE